MKTSSKKPLKVNCIRCKSAINVKYIEGEKKYSSKNNWDYWTETQISKRYPRYLCDDCLLELFYRYKKEFREFVKNPKKRNLLGMYINEGIIGKKGPFFLPE